MGAWNVGKDRLPDMQALALRDIYKSNQNEQDFSLCLLFFICSKNYEKLIAIHLSSTSHPRPATLKTKRGLP